MPRWLPCWKHIWLTPRWEEVAVNKVPWPMEGRPKTLSMKLAKLLWRLARWGLGMRAVCGEQAGLRDATCWTLEACCVASVAELRTCLVLCWQAPPPAQVPESLCKPRGCDLLVSFLRAAFPICSVLSLHLGGSGGTKIHSLWGWGRRQGLMSYFWRMMKKEKFSSF